MKSILWITGRLPYPLFSGDAIYTTSSIRALAARGVCIVVVGSHRHGSTLPEAPAQMESVEWRGAPASTRSGLMSVFTGQPRDAYRLASAELRTQLQCLLKKSWDWIVIDHANSGGVLGDVLAGRRHTRICYIAHNVEAVVRPEIASHTRGPRRWVMMWDAVKYSRLEKDLVAAADAVIAITQEDASHFSIVHANVHVVPPAFLGDIVELRTIDAQTPKSLLLIGSFEWGAKQRNLETIVKTMGPRLSAARITLNVVGAIPPALARRLSAGSSCVKFHGNIQDICKLAASSRGGLVAETLGGGFKLKILDYAFNRLPIFGLNHAMAGMRPEERAAMFLADDLEGVAAQIIGNVDAFDELNLRQDRLFNLVSQRFDTAHVENCIAKVFELG